MDQLIIAACFGMGPVGIVATAIFLANMLLAPGKIHQEQASRMNELETQIAAQASGDPAPVLSLHQRTILRACEPRSVETEYWLVFNMSTATINGTLLATPEGNQYHAGVSLSQLEALEGLGLVEIVHYEEVRYLFRLTELGCRFQLEE